MGRSTNITFESVASAANSILAKGLTLTNNAVRNEIGSGSLATIGRHMQSYRAGQTRISSGLDDTLSPEVISVISNHIATKVQQSNANLVSIQVGLQTEFDDLLLECERQSVELESIEESHAALESEFAVLKGRASELESQLVTLKDELAKEKNVSESVRIELAKSILKLEYVPKIEDELEQVRSAFENYRAQSISDLNLVMAESASLHVVAAVAKATMQGEITLRASVTDALREVTRQLTIANDEAKHHASEAAELRGKLQSKNETLVS